ncbi:MAG: hypothetical protein QNJ42_13320 [Crocosphaera sp.]|nr:hypothetical protein [Crocosphaera sp.]
MKSENDLIANNLLENESIIFKYNNVVMYVNVVNDYHVSPPLKAINPLIARLIDGRNSIHDENWLKNEELFIRGFFILTNYRILFFAKKEEFSIFAYPHSMGNSIKNRLYGLITIPLNFVTLSHRSFPLLKVVGYKILNIYVRNVGESSENILRYKFGFYFVNLSKLIGEIEKYKNLFENKNIVPFQIKLRVNQRLEKHNIFWIKFNNISFIFFLIIYIVISLYNIYFIFSIFLFTPTAFINILYFVLNVPLFMLKPFVNHD